MQTTSAVTNISSSYIRNILTAAQNDNVISLAGGLPAAKHLPLPLMQTAIQDLAKQESLFQYGSTAGYAPLLAFLRDYYQLKAEEGLLITNGSQQGLDLISRSFIAHNDQIVVEAPCYLGALQIFNLAQAQIHTIEQTTQGPNLTQLAQTFANHNIKCFYAVPDFHNPTGVCWSLTVRQQVAALCRQYQVTLIEDIPYRALRFSGTKLPLVASFCPEQALVLRSFSKMAAPGMRLGLVSGRTDWLKVLHKVKQASDLHTNLPMQAILLALLQHTDFEQYLARLCQYYQGNYLKLRTTLCRVLSVPYQLPSVAGGMFIWLTLDKINTMTLAKIALAQRVAIVPSQVFYPHGAKKNSAIRLNFTHASPEHLALGAQRLQDAIQLYTSG